MTSVTPQPTLPLSREEADQGEPVKKRDLEELSPEELAAAASRGEGRAFELLVEQFTTRIHGYLCRMTGNAHDAEDLTQDTFLKAHLALTRYAPSLSFSAWLFTIAKRTALNHYRALKVRREQLAPPEVEFNDPAVLLEAKDEAGALWEAARRLKKNQYEVLWLHYGEGFPIHEAARVMGIGSIHARVLLHRARQALAKLLTHRTS